MAGYGTKRSSLLKALWDSLTSDDVAFLAVMLGTAIDDIAPPNATRLGQIANLVKWAELHSCEAALVQEAMELNNQSAQLAAVGPSVLRHLQESGPWYRPPTPLETCIVGSDQAFIGRIELRQRLQQLLPSNGWRSLVVHGTERSGRSFTLELISFVIADVDDARIVDIDLKNSSPDLGPVDIVRRIAFQMTLDADRIPPQQEQAPRWNEELRDWLVGRIESGGTTCWLVIDAIDPTRPSDATMDLIWKLAAAARTRPRLRVVLLACSEPPPDHVRALRENIKPIDPDTIEAFFTLFYQHMGLQPGSQLNQLVRRATDDALAGVPAGGADRLERLQEEVARVARGIAGGAS